MGQMDFYGVLINAKKDEPKGPSSVIHSLGRRPLIP